MLIAVVVYLRQIFRRTLYKLHTFNILFFLMIFLSACTKQNKKIGNNIHAISNPDFRHSYANPDEVAVKHLYLNLRIDFNEKILKGFVRHDLNRKKKDASVVHFDSRQMGIDSITDQKGNKLSFKKGEEKEYFGSDLAVSLKPESESVYIYYRTNPEAEALQWLTPAQTHDKKHPFLFSQSQAILARTWIPCQDDPGIKFTYEADIAIDRDLMVLMSAVNDTAIHADRKYHFVQSNPVSTYLMAIAAGNLEFRNTGRNSGVYAEPGQMKSAAFEFSSMQSMIDSAEELYGPYRWGRYDVLVLPPSFPFGGMENPCLTFVTPTIIAGDQSLVSLIAHELAHSWSGNLVTNESWNDFWLNEGFTVYFEQRIMEKIYGGAYADMLTVLGYGELMLTIEDFKSQNQMNETHLYLDLKDRNPDDGLTDIAYEKGRFFLRHIEQVVGRNAFDVFLKEYFNENAFKPMNTEKFLAYLNERLVKDRADIKKKINADAWVYGPGIPEDAIVPVSTELEKAVKEANKFLKGSSALSLNTKVWTTHHWLHFLRNLGSDLTIKQLKDLDVAFQFTNSGNSEILCDWFKHTITAQYSPARPALEKFLLQVGRRKFLTPLYTRLSKNEEDLKWAKAVFEKARPGYHSVTVNTIEEILEASKP